MCSDCRCTDGYDIPELHVHWHEVATDHAVAGYETSGQARLLRNSAIGVVDASREKRDSIQRRMAKLMDLLQSRDEEQAIVWCDLNDEQRAIESALRSAGITYSSLHGSQTIEERELLLDEWRAGRTQVFLSKPVMYGAGVNLQQCHTMIFAGIGFKAQDVLQAIHRIHRFLQEHPCHVHLIYTEAEREVRRILEQKWTQHSELMAQMTAIIREYGLAQASLASSLHRSIGIERQEARGRGWTLANNDSVLETQAMPADSVHLVLTSIPFSTQYEYSPSYNDFGHTDDNEHFWQQMDYLTPELLRVLKPGRIACIHVKDRIVPGGMTGLGFQVVYPFHCDAIRHFTQHGFAYMGMKTIVTDVVRENNQTYRLGWTEQCKDGTKMGVGMPEYLLIFRKPPTENTNSYADEPVVKSKGVYSRSRWQVDAHGYARSSGNRLLSAEDLDGLTHQQIFQLFRKHSTENVYDYEEHVRFAEALERCPDCGHIHIGQKRCGTGDCACTKPGGRLPVTFMLFQPASWSDEVWADVTRMLSLNSLQAAAGRENHLCPMQFDIADRAITQYTMAGETVYDPFSGLGTVPYRALLLGREGLGCELSPRYHVDAVGYLRAAEAKVNTPTLFSLLEAEEGAA